MVYLYITEQSSSNDQDSPSGHQDSPSAAQNTPRWLQDSPPAVHNTPSGHQDHQPAVHNTPSGQNTDNDKGSAKKPRMNGFIMFSKHHRKTLAASNRDMKISQISVLIGKAWKVGATYNLKSHIRPHLFDLLIYGLFLEKNRLGRREYKKTKKNFDITLQIFLLKIGWGGKKKKNVIKLPYFSKLIKKPINSIFDIQ